jgi:2-polyprenyl-3-methyl-5-hydroxy-6-metoxy-1,4-benzoquinol methylase
MQPKRATVIGNWINIHDLTGLAHALLSLDREKLRLYWPHSSRDRTLSNWQHVESPPTNWWSIPDVQRRWNLLVSGNEETDPTTYIADTYLRGGMNLIALALACGAGARELRWAKEGCFSRIDAIDISPPRIEHARTAAKACRLDKVVNFQVDDVWQIKGQGQYDVVLAEQSLHHLAPIPRILAIIDRCLRPNGLLVVNEYIGPDRFQWTKDQLRLTTALLSLLPDEYRRLWNSRRVKRRIHRPSKMHMLSSDPTEAAHSSEIRACLDAMFTRLEWKPIGGTVLQLLFTGIAHNFLQEDKNSKRWLRICFAAEDAWLASGILSSDFVVAVYQKK